MRQPSEPLQKKQIRNNTQSIKQVRQQTKKKTPKRTGLLSLFTKQKEEPKPAVKQRPMSQRPIQKGTPTRKPVSKQQVRPKGTSSPPKGRVLKTKEEKMEELREQKRKSHARKVTSSKPVVVKSTPTPKGKGKPQPTSLRQPPKLSAKEELIEKNKKFRYAKIVKHGEQKQRKKETVFEEIKDEKVLTRRAKLETVKDINEVGFFEKISLVSYFNQKESGKLDERIVRDEYNKNTKILQRENSLKYFLMESARRNLEYGEYPEIKLQIDPRMKEELYACMDSKLLASYEITIEKQHEILTKMNVDPIIISMRLKVIE